MMLGQGWQNQREFWGPGPTKRDELEERGYCGPTMRGLLCYRGEEAIDAVPATAKDLEARGVNNPTVQGIRFKDATDIDAAPGMQQDSTLAVFNGWEAGWPNRAKLGGPGPVKRAERPVPGGRPSGDQLKDMPIPRQGTPNDDPAVFPKPVQV